ncbi:MAG: NHL repeat-containing protein [Calditrichaeota bacterium]|nr:NHL repeat-containing protein [Calditrichota bacterium]
MPVIRDILILMLLLHTSDGRAVGRQQEQAKFTVKFLFAFPEFDRDDLALSQPQALAVDAKGQVFVLDTGNNRILKFDRNGKFIYAVGGFGWEEEQFDQPRDISVKLLLDVFVADYNNERVERYDKDLNYLSSYDSDDTLPSELQFGFPTGIDISRHGELFVCDSENDRVLKLNSSGEPVLSFGDFNWGEGQLREPGKIEVTPEDVVYVTDREANDVVVFDYYGTYVTRFGRKILQQPNGLVWTGDQLLVADSGHDRVVVFDRRNDAVFHWGAKGELNGAFDNPVDVAVHEERIYVLDANNGRVQVFVLQRRGG